MAAESSERHQDCTRPHTRSSPNSWKPGALLGIGSQPTDLKSVDREVVPVRVRPGHQLQVEFKSIKFCNYLKIHKVLTVRNLHVFRGDRHVLRGLSFDLEAGSCLLVTGVNGAGKTTLLRALCGLVDAEEGTLRWRGAATARSAPDYHAELAYLGHDAPLKGDLSGRENVRYTVGLRRALDREAVSRALERVGANAFADRPVRSLSAGQRRRIAFAALWLCGATLWILDEPNTNLDTQGQALVAGLIEEQLAAGGLVVAAVHQELHLAAGRRVDLVIPGGR